jgi:hypothetical protein
MLLPLLSVPIELIADEEKPAKAAYGAGFLFTHRS